jgi:phosphoesterase RecJ-like protein
MTAVPDLYRPILDVLSRCRRVLVTTHVRPDGDALGTAAAMVLGMRHNGINSHVLLLSRLPSKYEFVFRESEVKYSEVDLAWPADVSLDDFDALLVVDTGTWNQLPMLAERVRNWSRPKLVVDHHLTQENWADAKLVVTHAAAAGEIAANLLEAWGVPLEVQLANALFLAIVSDTGWFQFANTRPQTLRLAARLMEAGVDTDRLYQTLYQNERAERIRLQTRAQDSLQLLAEDRLAVMQLSAEDFRATGGKVNDTENLINLPLQIATVTVSLLFTEPPDRKLDEPIRVSLRSKGVIDVARFAEPFAGGGHARAAGLKLSGTLAEVRGRVVEAMVKTLTASPEAPQAIPAAKPRFASTGGMP